MTKLFESWEWVDPKISDKYPKENLLKVVAKTEATTVHLDDPKYPKRIFTPEELVQSARTLIDREVGLNHREIIGSSRVLDAQYNKQSRAVEAILYVPTSYIDKIRRNEISKVSVEYKWRDTTSTPEGTVFNGIVFDGISLLEGKPPGDPNTEIRLFESKEGRLEGEVAPEHLGEPFAGYTNFDDCVSKNQDKEDPKAYCGTIMRAVECSVCGARLIEGKWIAKAVESNEPKPDEKDTRIKELEDAYAKVLKTNEDIKRDTDTRIEQARSEGKKEVVQKLRSIIPHPYIESKMPMSGKRLCEELKKVVHNEG